MADKENKSKQTWKEKWQAIRQEARLREREHNKEVQLSNKIFKYIVWTLLGLFILSVIGSGIYVYQSLNPVDASSKEDVEVTIPVDSTTTDVAKILEDSGLIKDAKLFTFYMKFNNDQSLQAGHYQFNKSMGAQEILETLQDGGQPIFVDADTRITVVEGATTDEIAKLVAENTAISEDTFNQTLKDKDFLGHLEANYPSLLEGVRDNQDLKVPLEGYLYPATYEYFAGMTAEELIEDMVASSNLVYQELKEDLANTYLSYHELLTLASLIEREAITDEDRGLVSGVFYNRLDAGMPLQSDISVLYALGEHKEKVTYADLEVDSPYNLYQNTGLAPGPMNSPSKSAITAAIYPTWSDYYYFLADIDSQKIYYSTSLEEHEALVEEYVNKDEQSHSTEESEDQSQENANEQN